MTPSSSPVPPVFFLKLLSESYCIIRTTLKESSPRTKEHTPNTRIQKKNPPASPPPLFSLPRGRLFLHPQPRLHYSIGRTIARLRPVPPLPPADSYPVPRDRCGFAAASPHNIEGRVVGRRRGVVRFGSRCRSRGRRRRRRRGRTGRERPMPRCRLELSQAPLGRKETLQLVQAV